MAFCIGPRRTCAGGLFRYAGGMAETDYRTSAHPVVKRTFVAHNFGPLLVSLGVAALLLPALAYRGTSVYDPVAVAVLSSLPLAGLVLLVFSRLRLDVELSGGEVRLRARRWLGRSVQTVSGRADFQGFELVDVPRGKRALLAIRLASVAASASKHRDALEIRRDRLERVVAEMNTWVRAA